MAHRKEALLILNLVPQLIQLLLLALSQIHLPRQIAQLLRIVRLPHFHVLHSSSPKQPELATMTTHSSCTDHQLGSGIAVPEQTSR